MSVTMSVRERQRIITTGDNRSIHYFNVVGIREKHFIQYGPDTNTDLPPHGPCCIGSLSFLKEKFPLDEALAYIYVQDLKYYNRQGRIASCDANGNFRSLLERQQIPMPADTVLQYGDKLLFHRALWILTVRCRTLVFGMGSEEPPSKCK